MRFPPGSIFVARALERLLVAAASTALLTAFISIPSQVAQVACFRMTGVSETLITQLTTSLEAQKEMHLLPERNYPLLNQPHWTRLVTAHRENPRFSRRCRESGDSDFVCLWINFSVYSKDDRHILRVAVSEYFQKEAPTEAARDFFLKQLTKVSEIVGTEKRGECPHDTK